LATRVSDDALVAAIASGDRSALASLYERYSKRLHDFARRTVQEPQAASDVVQNTFVKIWGNLQDSPPPSHPKAWIFTIARNEAVDEVRRSARAKPVGELADDALFMVDSVPGHAPDDALWDKEMARLVWSAASSLNVNAYSLLDMHLRQDLTLDEIGESLGVSSQNVYKQMSRLRESLGEAVSDALLRENRGDCPDLRDLLAGLGDNEDLTPTARRAISKHVRSCDVCEETRRRITAPAAIFARLVPLPLLPALREDIFSGIEATLGDSDAPTPAGRASGRLASTPVATRVVLAVLVGAAVVWAFVLLIPSSDGGSTPRDPDDALSTTHKVGQASALRQITIGWTPVEGAGGYSIVWDTNPLTIPDEIVDLPGTASEATSPSLDDGSWYFHLRTSTEDGAWTSTIHIGPFPIADPGPAPTSTTPDTAPSPTTSTAPTEEDPAEALADTYIFTMTYGEPGGGCGYAPFDDTVIVTLAEDGSASLSQAQHLSVGTWGVSEGVISIDLVLDTEFPETYTLASSDGGETVSGQNTYLDGVGCLTTFELIGIRDR